MPLSGKTCQPQRKCNIHFYDSICNFDWAATVHENPTLRNIFEQNEIALWPPSWAAKNNLISFGWNQSEISWIVRHLKYKIKIDFERRQQFKKFRN